MSEEAWATFWLIFTVACMVAAGLFLASVNLTPSYSRF